MIALYYANEKMSIHKNRNKFIKSQLDKYNFMYYNFI